jgi:hypothetical protein
MPKKEIPPQDDPVCSFCKEKATLVPAMFMGMPTGEIYKLESPMILIPDDPENPRPDREFLLNSFGRSKVSCEKHRNELERWIKNWRREG